MTDQLTPAGTATSSDALPALRDNAQRQPARDRRQGRAPAGDIRQENRVTMTETAASYFPADLRKTEGGYNPIRRIVAIADELGLDGEPFDAVRDHLARSRALVRHRSTVDDRRSDIAGRIGRGEIDVDAGIDEAVTLQLRAMGDGAVTKQLLSQASKLAERAALDSLRPWCRDERIVTDVLQPLITEVVDEVDALSADLPPEVVDPATASQAGAKPAAAWSRLEAAHRRWTTTHRLADMLRGHRLLPSPTVYAPHTTTGEWFSPTDHTYARPDRKPAKPRGPLGLLVAIAAGAKPGIYTAAEVDQNVGPLLPAPPPKRQGRSWPGDSWRPPAA